MYWHYDLFRDGVTWANGGTYIEELPKTGILSSIIIHAARGAALDCTILGGKTWRIEDFINPLEIVLNGSDKAITIPAQINHFSQWLDGGVATPDKKFNYGTSTRRFHSAINFGRHTYDPQMGLDLSRYDSVEVKFKNTGSATYFGGDWALDVILVMQREPAGPPIGYLKKEVWREWTTVADEWKYLELPTSNKIRRVVMQVIPDEGDTYKEAETTPYNVAYDIKLALGSRTKEIFNGNLRDLWYINAFDHGRDVIRSVEPYISDGYGIWTGLGQTLGSAGLRLPHDGTQDTASTSLVPGDDSSSLRRMTDTDADQDALLVMGLALENCAYFRFDHDPNPATWLDPNVAKTVTLDVHTRNAASAADGTIKVALERLVTY